MMRTKMRTLTEFQTEVCFNYWNSIYCCIFKFFRGLRRWWRWGQWRLRGWWQGRNTREDERQRQQRFRPVGQTCLRILLWADSLYFENCLKEKSYTRNGNIWYFLSQKYYLWRYKGIYQSLSSYLYELGMIFSLSWVLPSQVLIYLPGLR